jgi:hypothetical protein
MLALGVIAVLAAVAVDPAAAALLLDADFLVVLGAVGLAVARGDVRQVAHRLLTSPAAVLCRAGVAVTRSEPRSLLR